MKYLISTTETYRVDTEEEANALIESAKHEDNTDLTKYSCIYKEQKAKGEVVQSWYRVTLSKFCTSEKEPMEDISVTYEAN